MASPTPFPEELSRRFRPLRSLGAGGMGQVILCEDRTLEREVAVKLLAGGAKDAAIQRFLREAEALAQLRHPHVVQVFDSGMLEDGTPFLVLEALEGASVDRVAEVGDPARLARELADALDELHRHDLVHRDLKPANVFLTEDGRAVLLDFGLIRDRGRTLLTRTGVALGTPAYMAPEALTLDSTGPSVDWYGLGATLYEVLERRPPRSIEDVVAMSRGEDPGLPPFERAGEDHPLVPLVRALMDPDPGARPSSRGAVEELLPRGGARPPEGAPSPPLAGEAGPRPARVGRVAGLLWGLVALVAAAWLLPPATRGPGGEVESLTGSREVGGEPARDLAAELARWGLAPMAPNPQGYRRVRNLRDDSVLIFVPAGTFPGRAVFGSFDPGPVRTVRLRAHLFGETEVTVGQWLRFQDATGLRLHRRGETQLTKPGNPVVYMSHLAAERYCAWAGGHLPTLEQYERAAAGTDGRPRPWGDAPPDATRARFGIGGLASVLAGSIDVVPARSLPAGVSPIGAFEVMGNAGCWSRETVARENGQIEAALLGQTLHSGADALFTWSSRHWPIDQPGSAIGLRLVREVPPELEALLLGEVAAPPPPPGLRPLGPNERGHREFAEARTGARWILVPGGEFTSRASHEAGNPGPPRPVTLPAFLVDRHEVSVARYARYLEDTGAPPPDRFDQQRRRPENPVSAMDHLQAREYAAWAGARLIRVREFERAAAGVRARRYPWGDQPPTPELATFGRGGLYGLMHPERYLTAVTGHPEGRSPVGALNLAGNVCCWTEDLIPARDGEGRAHPGSLGGSFLSPAEDLASSYLFSWPPETQEIGLGIRLAREVPPGLHALEDPRPGPPGDPGTAAPR